MKLTDLEKDWDLVVIGGGITGAGVLREAVRAGLRTLLVEKKDFAWGTSSRSSKLVHGGLRYLKEGKVFLTLDSVRERQRLITEAPGLVEPKGFLWPSYQGQSPGKLAIGLGLFIYDVMAQKRQHAYYGNEKFLRLVPEINTSKMNGGFGFTDAQTDDARLVLRLIHEAVEAGGSARSYATARQVLRNKNGEVTGLALEDTDTGETTEVNTRAIINATGWWAEELHKSPQKGLHLRPLRGSHLVVPFWRLPLGQAVSFIHPTDRRPIFAVPWEGATIVGTTDLDHDNPDPNAEPSINAAEAEYLLDGLSAMFPGEKLSESDCVATFSGVRPVLSTGKKAASKESREHVVWINKGLVTITGGKLTTFRLLALDALKAVAPFMTKSFRPRTAEPVFTPAPSLHPTGTDLDAGTWRRLYGRYGLGAETLVSQAAPQDLELIPGTDTLFAELPYAAQYENVRHLEDLLMRRVRAGFVLADGGAEHLDRVQALCAPALDWDENQWEQEKTDYQDLWQSAYSVPGKS